MPTVDRKGMLRLLDSKLSAEDVATLIFELGLDQANLEGEIKRAHLRSLIEYYEQRDEIGRLIAAVASLRPDVLTPDTVYTPTVVEPFSPGGWLAGYRRVVWVGLAAILIVAVALVGGQWYLSRSPDTDARSSDADPTLASLTQKISNQPNNARAHFERGEYYRSKQEWQLAINDYTQAVTLNPAFEEAYYMLGICYEVTGDTDRALENYTQSLELRRGEWGFLSRGELYTNLGEYDLAIADFTEAVRLQADFSRAYYARGLAYRRKKDNVNAIADLEKVIDLNDPYWRGQAEEQLRSLKAQ